MTRYVKLIEKLWQINLPPHYLNPALTICDWRFNATIHKKWPNRATSSSWFRIVAEFPVLQGQKVWLDVHNQRGGFANMCLLPCCNVHHTIWRSIFKIPAFLIPVVLLVWTVNSSTISYKFTVSKTNKTYHCQTKKKVTV